MKHPYINLTFLILLFICHPSGLTCQVDTLYIKFSISNSKKTGYFNNNINYLKKDSVLNIFEVQYKSQFNKIPRDKKLLQRDQILNEMLYTRKENFHFSYLINTNNYKNRSSFLNFINNLNVSCSRLYTGFDLEKVINEPALDTLNKEEIYQKIIAFFDNHTVNNLSGGGWEDHQRVEFLRKKYYENYKHYKQKIISKKKVKSLYLIDLNKKIKTSQEFITIFRLMSRAKIIYLTTSFDRHKNYVLFNEVFFNMINIKPSRIRSRYSEN
ncbi:hypothetical protein [Dokdonia sp. Hel_I_53]|uniref:hypothetical protein n=1 Tax=Dokdonia sp. Hel_I_53 TaxID=1566287 RepID=UPI00119C5C2B|nr:hypothetical protein [Dokdonia sp. Hel_I_53]TVZ52693.1 hypothetical protein OD90_1877 [Dokdonia sp. Hel_I_53]